MSLRSQKYCVEARWVKVDLLGQSKYIMARGNITRQATMMLGRTFSSMDGQIAKNASRSSRMHFAWVSKFWDRVHGIGAHF